MQKIFYTLFAAQVLLLSSTLGFAAAQSEDNDTGNNTGLTSQITNLTNATSSPEDVKKMEVIGGTVNQTLNASSGLEMNETTGLEMNASSNMTAG